MSDTQDQDLTLPDSLIAHLSEGADDIITTSCAVVILKGKRAYKVKKSVDYGFLDFTSVEKRRKALLRELRYNQRMASDIYLGVEEIQGESVLVMRRFDTAGVLAEQSQAQDDWAPDLGLMHDLGSTVAKFHAGSEICRDAEHEFNIKYVIDSNKKNIDVFRDELGAEAVDAYDVAIQAAYAELEDDVKRRFTEGYVRHCHGDLHLGNILIENGKPVLFDCIEFNERLSQIDVLYDLGFLLMDLWVRGHEDAANTVLNIYVERASRLEDDIHSVYAGLKLLPLYMSVRAGVRCHVNANYGGTPNYAMEKAKVYLAAAHRFLEIKPAELIAVGGLSGSGKSSHSRRIAPATGRAPGALILRSDEMRKRLWAFPEFETLPKEAYTPAENERVYNHMFDLARTAIQSGQSVILDATFRNQDRAREAKALAENADVTFSALWMDVPAEERLRRVLQRTNDVSDATPDIAGAQTDPVLDEALWTRTPNP
ncbi:AAA family ATPase [Asticcacaulis sp. BYS171W]|uniref:AAA family ATPase n=1 Tax=Asticcacaulis aquaticus TaxID=2984212 RepID=A0ABT5HWB5_9CAUL|nr:AAA family ATPase [Asticcacaulis aquaticus]MDC7684360.1 AAA family ATPase [Asticcacaulis aquaticus]